MLMNRLCEFKTRNPDQSATIILNFGSFKILEAGIYEGAIFLIIKNKEILEAEMRLRLGVKSKENLRIIPNADSDDINIDNSFVQTITFSEPKILWKINPEFYIRTDFFTDATKEFLPMISDSFKYQGPIRMTPSMLTPSEFADKISKGKKIQKNEFKKQKNDFPENIEIPFSLFRANSIYKQGRKLWLRFNSEMPLFLPRCPSSPTF